LVVLGILAVTGALLGLVLDDRLDRRGVIAVSYGAGVAAANALLAHALMRWSEGRSTKAFLIAVLGGMGGRMAFVLGAVILAVVALDLPKLPLLVSLLAHFVVFLGLEMAALHAAPAVRAEVL
jgi:uncharacterized protein (UPF0261 family)